ncbi:glycosyl transferase family 90 domain-containing protein [Hirsutella rhossiliensis]|uniref:Glycosyl transferase family 90 domain-containing protein n=1 Tax=Hirsutella rhossiliensis TaxID=111463 RepID=A0A9P8SCH1_9HYPO|nr:glycosyl transferase family 90 domain-containing protein [Hirsutella rhossiliensis]KAH0957556.1 glycosyl transferase family 90 domain-containing protein [Hirsutella rhossiliensis]
MSFHRRLCAPRLYRRKILAPLLSVLVLVLVYLSLRDPARDCAVLLRPAHCALIADWKHGPPAAHAADHPIDGLIREARLNFQDVLRKRSTSLQQAARRYQERRGRHPPPGFDAWFAAATKSRAIVVEDFFDRIHHDISPLWALEPRQLRLKAHHQATVVRVRGAKVDLNVLPQDMPHRVEQWIKLVSELAPNLPDLDMPVNTMDESRILVPWETVNEYVAKAQKQRHIIDVGDAIDHYGGLDDVDNNSTLHDDTLWITDEANKYWDHLAAACPPESPARRVPSLTSFGEAIEYPSQPVPAYTHRGFVHNFTVSQDPCWQPHLRGMHGTFIESISMSTTHELVPMFAESKLLRNNELLIPAAVYLDDGRIDYSGGSARGGSWARKNNAVVWRGVASGGRNRKDNWRHMHRNRFVQMLNGTAIAALEAGNESQAPTFRLPDLTSYSVHARDQGLLGRWVSTWADVGFVEAPCHPPEDVETLQRPEPQPPAKFCSWLRPWFSVADSLPMEQQYTSKFLPDIDGNSFSGRYRAFLLSTSLPLKSTIYAEWHDDRLFPWVHFVPMDNSFMDVYALIDYFIQRSHDAEARSIADQGKTWAETVLRREDMKLYVWRLLLEYARVVDDNRHKLAFIADKTK